MDTNPLDSPLMQRKVGRSVPHNPDERMSSIDRYRIIQKLGDLGKERLSGKGVWLALNYQRLSKDGLTPVGTLAFDVLTEEQWRERISEPMLKPIGLEVSMLRHGPEEEYCVPLPDSIVEGETVVVKYWGFEIADNKGGEGDGDPRAQMLCEALTDQSFPWPYQMVVAQVSLADATDVSDLMAAMGPEADLADLAASLPQPKSLQPGSPLYAPSREAVLSDMLEPPGSPTPMRAGKLKPKDLSPVFGPALTKGRMTRDEYVPHEEHDASEAEAVNRQLRDEESERWKSGWYKPAADEGRAESPLSEPRWVDQDIDHLAEAAEYRARAFKMDEEANACRVLGDVKTAYSKSAEAIELALKAEVAEKAHADKIEAQAAEEKAEKTYFPPTEYQYPDGTARTIEAGWYTPDEHMARTLEEQELLMAVRSIAEKDGMSKYESPLTRTPSQADSMTVAESLRDSIAHKSERARNVMATVHSREPSPPATPSLTPAEAPKLDEAPPLLPEDVVTAKLRGIDLVGSDLMARAKEVVAANPPKHVNEEDGFTNDQAALTLAAFAAITGVAPEDAVAEAHRRYGKSEGVASSSEA